MSLSLRFAAGSHKGMIREGNEDSGYAGPVSSRSPTAWAARPPAKSPAPR